MKKLWGGLDDWEKTMLIGVTVMSSNTAITAIVACFIWRAVGGF